MSARNPLERAGVISRWLLTATVERWRVSAYSCAMGVGLPLRPRRPYGNGGG